ncbi:large ribosomal subunit protein mL54 [Eucyclogobius newberryi]|uniref:large ribosomal subunit protein mL54 n=1 Tax=Eucyclogobius newberryi TaxID=166745 RepID=UPI003B5B3BD0
MSQYGLFRTVSLARCFINRGSIPLCHTNPSFTIQTCGYAKKVAAKGKGKSMVKDELKGPEVCTDPARLTNYAVGANIFKQGEDPKLKTPEDYPEWLFQLNLGSPNKLSQLEPDTWEYWKRLRKENCWRHNKLHKGKKF